MTQFLLALAFSFSFLTPPKPATAPDAVTPEVQAIQKKYGVSTLPNVTKEDLPSLTDIHREMAAARAKMATPGKNEILMGDPNTKGKTLYIGLVGAPAVCDDRIKGYIYYESSKRRECVCYNGKWRFEASDSAPGQEDGC